MKKFLSLLMAIALSATMAVFVACNKAPASSDVKPIECNIKFAKTVDEKYHVLEWYEENEFEINTKIYVIVEFTLINNSESDNLVDFKVQIPYAKYYSTHDYKRGVIEPIEEYKDVIADDGNIEQMIELSGMAFNVKAGQIPFQYTYCFAIEANRVCEDVQFRAVFTSDADGSFAKNQTFTKSYSFVQPAGEE